MAYDASQMKQRTTRTHALLTSSVLNRDAPEDGVWKPAFAELIALVDDLLIQADQAGKRIDFLEGVGVQGKVQDVTSLVRWLRSSLPGATADSAAQSATSRLNRYFGQGTGYFANGSFFTGEHQNEVAFFLDDQRIYLNRHLQRAVNEAESSLQTPG